MQYYVISFNYNNNKKSIEQFLFYFTQGNICDPGPQNQS